MKWFTFVSLSLLGSASAYTMPTMATRAVGRKAPVKSATRTVSKKKVVAKPVVKAATKKVVTKKSITTKKVVAKKVVAKKVVAKKVVAKKVVAKNPARKNPFARKAAVKKPPASKPVAKKTFGRKTVAKKVVAKKVVAKKLVGKSPSAQKSAGPPASKGYPSFSSAASKVAFNVKVSGSPPPRGYQQPNFADPRLQIKRDPAVWAAAAKTRQAPLSGNAIDYLYEDGLTVIEQRQKATLPAFLSGSAKSQIDTTAIREIEADNLLFGLDPDRFQLFFITVFGLFTLVGCLSGTVQL